MVSGSRINEQITTDNFIALPEQSPATNLSSLERGYIKGTIPVTQNAFDTKLPIHLEPRGGGGTDFCPVFEWVEENQIDAVCLIYLTDLCCHTPIPNLRVFQFSG